MANWWYPAFLELGKSRAKNVQLNMGGFVTKINLGNRIEIYIFSAF
jgi:hypothetical protein